MFWLSNVILIIFFFFASVAIISAFEVVILAFRALPSSFWKSKETFTFLRGRIFFGLVFNWWFLTIILCLVSWHEALNLVKWLEWCWFKSWSVDGCFVYWIVHQLSFGCLDWYILVLLSKDGLVFAWASRIFICQAWTLVWVLIGFWWAIKVVTNVEILESVCHRWDSVLDTIFLFWSLFFLFCGFFESFDRINWRIAIDNV